MSARQPPVAEVAVIGGSGFYTFLDAAEEHVLSTPYGDPSGPIAVGTLHGRRVAFLARHGVGHTLPPHAINYRANLWALRSLGVRQVLAPCAVGGLGAGLAPGDIVAPDQLVDRTTRRVGSFVERGALHLPFADPYCPRLLTAVAAHPEVSRRGHDGGDRGSAVLHARRVPCVRRERLVTGQHDRPARGGPGP